MSRSKLFVIVAGLMPVVSTACYTYVPVETSASAPLGKRVAVDLSDRGRAALADRLGSGVLRVEGMLAADDSSQVVVNVWKVSQIGGIDSPWAGESLELSRNYIGGVFERRVSRTRSTLAAGVAVAAMVWVARSQGLFGSTDVVDNSNPGGPPNSQSRAVP